jgi:hypothetical protein
MEAVKVQYTVKKEYAEKNKRNIEQVMAELRSLNNVGVKYSAFMLADGKTFVHFGLYADSEAKSIVGELDSFKKFRQELQESQPEVPPKADDLNLVASAYDIF